MLEQIASFIRYHDRFAVSTHISPEGDALGSALAVRWILEALGKHVVVVLRDPVPAGLAFLPGARDVRTPSELEESDYEYVILVDCGKADRIGEELHRRFQNRFVINLDHHADNPRFGQLHYVREAASATLLVHELAQVLNVPLDPRLATCLYAGLVADTDAFRNANVDDGVLRRAAEFVAAGADPREVALNLYERLRWPELKMLGYALSHARLEGGIIWSAIPWEVFARYNASISDTENVVEAMRTVEGVRVAVLFKELEGGKVKISLRSKGALAVNGVARAFGGGGHEKAAGCLVSGDLEEVRERVLAELQRHLELTEASPS